MAALFFGDNRQELVHALENWCLETENEWYNALNAPNTDYSWEMLAAGVREVAMRIFQHHPQPQDPERKELADLT